MAKSYERQYPLYSLCGLNCGLCPNYHAAGSAFHCPGCGGKGFYPTHPTCAIVSCNLRTENVEFCFLCSKYPCERYAHLDDREGYDSSITYQNMASDVHKIKTFGVAAYMAELEQKVALLTELLANYNSGRQKMFFCTAVNLLDLADVEQVMAALSASGNTDKSLKEKSTEAVRRFEAVAAKRGISLKLRKKKKL